MFPESQQDCEALATGFIGWSKAGFNNCVVTEFWILQELHPQKNEWMTGYSLEPRLVDQLITQQQRWIWSKASVNSTIKQRLIEQTQAVDSRLEGSGGSTLVDTLS